MKRIIIALVIVAGTLTATTSHAQVYIGGRIGLGLPVPRVYLPVPPHPRVIYENSYAAPECYYPRRDEHVVVTYGNGYGEGRYRDYPYYERYHRQYRDYDRRDRGYDHDRRWGHHRNW